MNRQCLNIEQMQHLKELGVDTSKASMVLLVKDHYDDVLDWDEEIFGFNEEEKTYEYYDAETGNYDHSFRKDYGVFTLQDILDLLPKRIGDHPLCILWEDETVSYQYYDEYKGVECLMCYFIDNGSLIYAAYKLLCWCAENGYIETKGGNK